PCSRSCRCPPVCRWPRSRWAEPATPACWRCASWPPVPTTLPRSCVSRCCSSRTSCARRPRRRAGGCAPPSIPARTDALPAQGSNATSRAFGTFQMRTALRSAVLGRTGRDSDPPHSEIGAAGGGCDHCRVVFVRAVGPLDRLLLGLAEGTVPGHQPLVAHLLGGVEEPDLVHHRAGAGPRAAAGQQIVALGDHQRHSRRNRHRAAQRVLHIPVEPGCVHRLTATCAVVHAMAGWARRLYPRGSTGLG